MKKVALIILGYNSLSHYHDNLASLRVLDYPKDSYEVFIFDNGSKDDSLAYVEANFPEVKILENQENLGFAAGYNKAVESVGLDNFDYMLLLNDDTVCAPDFLSQMVAVLQSAEDIGAVQARLMMWPEKNKINSLGNKIHFLGFGFSDGCYQEYLYDAPIKEIAYGSGAALLIKSEIIKKLGLFEPDFFMYHEDLDFGWKLRLAGYKTMLVPQAVVYHKYKFAKSMRQYYWMERNRGICLLKNYKIMTLLLILPALIVMELGLLAFSFKSGFWREKLKVYCYFLKLSTWKLVKRERRAIRGKRVKRDKEVIKLFTGRIENQEIDNWLLRKAVNPVFDLYWRVVRWVIFW